MFETVAMSRLTVAAPVANMEQVLRACTNEGCVHIETYTNFEEGVHVGQAVASDEANHVSALLAKVRAAVSAFKPVNVDGPMPVEQVKKLIEGSFPEELQKGLDLLDAQRDAEAEVATLQEQVKLMTRLAPLGVDLELLLGSDRVEVFVAETNKASKARSTFGALASKVEMAHAPGVVAVACMPSDSAEVQMALGELGGKPVQIPALEGSPKALLESLVKSMNEQQAVAESSKIQADTWAEANARNLLAAHEFLSKEDEIFTAPTQMAVTGQAFALDAWVPSNKESSIQAALKHIASHVDVEPFVDDHHGHGHDDHHGDDHGHASPPIALENGPVSKPFELLVGLVGRPAYGTFDPTFFMMLTFPVIYGLILGDFGYGLIIFLLGMYLGTKPFAADPVVNNGITILKWMGVWCIIWGLLFAEGFGFVWDEDWSPLAPLYEVTKDLTYGNIPSFITDTLGMSHTYVPFHRASGALQDYVLLSVYLGIVHLAFGFILGFINVARAHGLAAAFFEKGSWMIILFGGTLHIYAFLTDDAVAATTATPWAMLTLVGVLCLIVGLAVYEKFGWAGGIIMGPIETFGLLANTLSYLRVMGVGVAGVKIAEISITMGWELMMNGGNIGLMVVGLLLFVFIQAFALALGLLSPSIHAARLHFVEWMGKFYDGTGRVFTPLGGRTLHTEGQS